MMINLFGFFLGNVVLHKVHFGLVRSSVLKRVLESCGLAVIIYP